MLKRSLSKKKDVLKKKNILSEVNLYAELTNLKNFTTNVHIGQ